MRPVRSNRLLIVTLVTLLVVLVGGALWLVGRGLGPAEARQDPAVLAIVPEGGGPVSRATTLEVLFDQRMDHGSVEAAIRTEPTFEYEVAWRAEAGGERLMLKPQRALEWETPHRVIIAGEATNIEGRPLGAPVTIEFSTGSETQVVQAIPDAGAAGVDRASAITIRFDRPLVEVDSLEAQERLPQPVLIEPPVAGIGRWLSPDTYGFYPETPLAPGTEYRVTVSPVVAPGVELPEPFSWSFVTDGPRLDASFPFDGASEVGRAAAIRLLFNQEMDRESVEGNFLLARSDDPTPIAGEYRWEDERTLTFVPADPLAPATDYEIAVGEGARATSGGSGLASPYRAIFTTVEYLTAESVQPAAGSTGVSIVPTDTLISVQFNHPVVPLVGLAERETLPNPLRIEPGIDGRGEWVTTSLFVFRPDEPLAPSTEYRVRVDPELRDTLGSFQDEPYSWSFTTLFPRVLRVEPSNPRRMVPHIGPIALRFNQAMDRESTAAAFSLVDSAGTPVPGRIGWEADDSRMTFVPDAPLTRGASYRVELAAGARGAVGGQLESPFRSEIVAAPEPQVLRSAPVAGATNVPIYDAIRLTFNTPIDDRELEELITVEPEPTEIFTYYDPEALTLYVNLAGGLQPSTEYRFTLSPELQDLSGQPLGEPFTITFTSAAVDSQLGLVRGADWLGLYSPYTETLQLVNHINLTFIEFELYRPPLTELLRLLPQEAWELRDRYTPPTGSLVASWSTDVEVPLNARALFKTVIPLDAEAREGFYFLRVKGTTRDGGPPREIRDQLFMLYTQNNLTIKRATDESLVWATNLRTGDPVAGLPVTLYDLSATELGSGVTDGDGLVRIATPDLATSDNPFSAVIAIAGDGDAISGIVSSDWIGGIGAWEWNIPTNLYPAQLYGTIYTERPLYRPGQTGYFRGVLRQRDGSVLRLPEIAELTVHVEFNGEEILSQPVTLSPFGSFSGEFTLDDEAETGSYRIWLEQEEIGYCYPDFCNWEGVDGFFQVAEYRLPEFEVGVEFGESEVVQGDTAAADVMARYYFGGSLADAPATWRLFTQPYRFEAPGLSGYWSWRDDDDLFRERFVFESAREVVRDGERRLDQAGDTSIRVDTDLDRLEEAEGSQRFSLEVEVSDINDAVVSGRADLIVHAGEFYIGLQAEEYLGNAGDPFALRVATADSSGALAGGREVAVEFYQREWFSVREEDDRGAVSWTSSFSDTLVATRPVTTGPDGLARVEFTPEAGGSYTVLARATDGRGNEIRSRAYFWVTDPDNFVAWGRDNDARIDLVADKDLYEVGETARILVPTPFEGMTTLITQERFSVESARVVRLDGTASEIEIPITADMAPNVYIGVVAVLGSDQSGHLPEFVVGYLSLEIAPTERELTIEIEGEGLGEGESLQPRDEATLSLRVTGPDGTPEVAELSLAVVDRALLSLAPNQQRTVRQALYETRPLAVQTGVALINSVDRISAQFAANAKGGGGGGGGEFGPELLRSNFVETAFWRADIVTDADGRAEVSFTLPDNLTTWEISAQAITAESQRVGVTTEQLRTTRPLLVRPTLPRFMVVGDQATLRVAVHNNTTTPFNGTLRLDADGVTLAGAAARQIQVPVGGRVVERFEVTVEDVEKVAVTIRAEGSGLADGVVRDIPVYPIAAPEVVATSGLIRAGEGAATESIRLPAGSDPTQGELTLELAPSLAAAAEGTLGWLASYPYDHTEAVASVMLPNIAALRTLDTIGAERPTLDEQLRHEIELGVQQLVTLQNGDGGWGWWRNSDSRPWLSAYALLGLHQAESMGLAVPEERLARGARYLERWLSATAEQASDETLDTRAFVLYVLSETGRGDVARAAALFDQASLLGTDGRAFLLMALDNAGDAQRSRVQTLAATLTANAILTATGAHWQESNPDPTSLDSGLRSSAIVLRALSRVQPEHMLLPQAVRWLLGAREAAHWQTTQESAWALLALSDYMIATGELEADYEYEVALNGRVLLSDRADEETLTEPRRLELALAELLLDAPNQLIITRALPDRESTGTGRLYYSAWLRTFERTRTITPLNRGIDVARRYEAVDPVTLRPLGSAAREIEVGDVILVRLTVNAPNDLHYFTLEDPIPAGFEVIDPALLSTSLAAQGPTQRQVDTSLFYFWFDGWSQSVVRDEKVVLFSDRLSRGTYEYSYLLRATVPGSFTVLPVTAYEQYHPERFGRSGSEVVVVGE